MRVVTPYLVLGTVVFIWALLIIRTKFPKIAEEAEPEGSRQHGRFKDLFHHRHFVQGVIAQFFYVGRAGGNLELLHSVHAGLHPPARESGRLLPDWKPGGVWRRQVHGHLPDEVLSAQPADGDLRVRQHNAGGLGDLFPGWVGVWALFLTSFFMSLMFPTIFALGIKELGPNTKLGGSMIIMAIIGGAVATPIMGLLFQMTHSMAVAMIVVLVCYVFITYYAFVGSKVRAPKVAELAVG